MVAVAAAAVAFAGTRRGIAVPFEGGLAPTLWIGVAPEDVATVYVPSSVLTVVAVTLGTALSELNVEANVSIS